MCGHLVGAFVELLVGQRLVTEADCFSVGSARHLRAKEIDDRFVRRIGRCRGVVLDDQRPMIVIVQQGKRHILGRDGQDFVHAIRSPLRKLKIRSWKSLKLSEPIGDTSRRRQVRPVPRA